MVRFYWKKQSVSSGTDAGKSKILRSVQYPLVLDTYQWCTEELKKSLKLGRDYEQKLRKAEDDAALSGANLDKDEETKEPVRKKKNKDQFDIDDNVVY